MSLLLCVRRGAWMPLFVGDWGRFAKQKKSRTVVCKKLGYRLGVEPAQNGSETTTLPVGYGHDMYQGAILAI